MNHENVIKQQKDHETMVTHCHSCLQRERERDAVLLPDELLTEITQSSMYEIKLQHNAFVYMCIAFPLMV